MQRTQGQCKSAEAGCNPIIPSDNTQFGVTDGLTDGRTDIYRIKEEIGTTRVNSSVGPDAGVPA